MMEAFLVPEDYHTIITNYFRRADPINHSTTNKTVDSHTIDRLSDKVEGFIGEHFILKIEVTETNPTTKEVNNHKLSFFLKLLNDSKPIVVKVAQSVNAYENEAFLYDTMLEELRAIGVDTSFAPLSYFMKMNRLMVLENLAENEEFDVKTAAKTECFDLVHCKVMLTTLAKLHAGVVVYQRKMRLTDPNYNLAKAHSEILEPVMKPDNASIKCFNCTMDALVAVSELVFEDTPAKAIKFKRMFRDFLEISNGITKPVEGEIACILHSDLWVNNLLFHYDRVTGLPVTASLVDYQVIKYGNPAVDVVQGIVTNTRKALRDEHYDTLLRHYYDEFGRWLVDGAAIATGERLDMKEVWTWYDFRKACHKMDVVARLRAYAGRTMTFLPYEQVATAFTTDEEFSKFLFEDRTISIITAFHKDPLYKEIINEDITELYQLLYNVNRIC